jgi:hypothetical protein
MIFDWYSVNYLDRPDQIKETTRLVTLSITTDKGMSFSLLEQLIHSCKTSLQNIKLDVSFSRPIGENQLGELFKSCEKLENLVFCFQIINQKVNIDDCLRSFQSKWWLDTRRPAVYIQQTSGNNITIVSMPSKFPFCFKNNLSNWYFNKGNQDSSFVRFNKTNTIHFTNDVDHPINLAYLCYIDRIFTSSNQSLRFDYWDLEAVDTIFDMVNTYFFFYI